MASRSLSLWLTLSALILGVAGCDGGESIPPLPPNPIGKNLPDKARSTVVADRTTAVANGKDEVNITVTVAKADGVVLPNLSVTLAATGDGNTLTPATGRTDAQGVLRATLKSTIAGAKRVTASVEAEGGPVVLDAQPVITFTAPPAVSLVFSTQSIQAVAGAPLSAVEVVLEDADGNPVTSATGAVTLQVATGPAGGMLEGGTATANVVNGVAVFSQLVIKKAGPGYSLRATWGTLTAVSPTFEVLPAAPASLELTGLGASISAGTTASLQVTAYDAFNNVAPSYAGTVRFTSNDPAATLPGDYTFSAADGGQKTFPGVVLRTMGARTVTVRDTATASFTDSLTVTVTGGTATQLVLSVPATPVTAGSAFNVTVSARDEFNNVITAYRGLVQFSADDTRATLPPSYAFTAADAGSRVFSVTLGTAGPQPLRVTDGTLNGSATVSVTPGTATRLALTGLPGTVTAGAVSNVTVTAYDGFDNVATGYSGTVRFTSTDAQGVLPADYTFTAADAGDASFPVGLRTAGTRTVTVTDVGNAALSDSATTTVNPGSVMRLAFLVQPTNGRVRVALSPVRVGLQDAYGNLLTTATSPRVTVLMSNVNNPTGIMLSGTLAADPVNGVAEFTNLIANQEFTDLRIAATAPNLPEATSNPFSVVDDIAPATAVLAATALSNTTVRVTWTAVGDDGNQGTATSHELRYAFTPITTEAEFANATLFPIGSSPQAPGSSEQVDVTGLNLSVDHYFALKVIDGAGNFSRSASVKVDAIQVGNVIISEFSALGAEFIELHNPTASPVDVRGYKLRNAAGTEADLRAPNDPNGTGTTMVVVPPGGFLYGIPNPSGAIPAGVGFVYGAPGMGIALTDTGDTLAVVDTTGTVEDKVDFRAFVTSAATPLTATSFVGLAGSSTQLDSASLTAAANDTATNWCVSFYPAGSKGSRVTNTASAANGSCNVAVLNEVFFKDFNFDDTNTFVEIAGPGGAVIGGAKIIDIEGKNPGAGTRNGADGESNPGDVDGEYTIPAGTRIPADGLLLIADTDAAGNTSVPNFVDGVDLRTIDMNLEDGPSDSIQLVSAAGTLLDALGYDPTGANLDVAVAFNNLATYEVGTARGQTAANTPGSSLARATTSVDTENNRNDFHLDPSPTPGVANDTVSFTVTNLTPNDGPATNGASGINVTGTDFALGMRAGFGSIPPGACTVTSSTTATCTAMANLGNAVARVNVTFNQTSNNVGVPNFVLTNGFTYTGRENETNSANEADVCTLVSPATFSVVRNQTTMQLVGRILEAGVTDLPGGAAGILAEVGFGTNNTNPSASNAWRFFPASHSADTAEGDEYVGTFTAPTNTIDYSFTFRFSQDGGLRWTYCDLDGAGSTAGFDFSFTNVGRMTVTAQ